MSDNKEYAVKIKHPDGVGWLWRDPDAFSEWQIGDDPTVFNSFERVHEEMTKVYDLLRRFMIRSVVFAIMERCRITSYTDWQSCKEWEEF